MVVDNTVLLKIDNARKVNC